MLIGDRRLMTKDLIDKDSNSFQPVSSAELTALWRCAYPSISHDNLSQSLVSEEAKRQSDMFISMHQYPLVTRKISARAGYIFNEAQRLIEKNHCDSVISFACGFSMLGFLIAKACGNTIKVVDTDLADILLVRQQRIHNLSVNHKMQEALSNIKHLEFDLEKAVTENIDLATYFNFCERPVIILEGITYFLQAASKSWLLNALMKWHDAAVIVEYWPENSLEISRKIKNSFDTDLSKNFKEKLKSFMSNNEIEILKKHYDTFDIGIGEAEARLSTLVNETPQLIDQNEYYPIRILSGYVN